MQYYQSRVRPLFEKILDRKLVIARRSYQSGYAICIRACGEQAMKTFHVYLQFPVGRKANTLRMPKLIFNNHEYWKAYVRGMFDSSGSLYLRRTAGKYRNPVIEISSPSLAHLTQLKEILHDLDFHFWLEKSNLKIRMAGRKNMERFFKEISPHNNTKLKKFATIMRTKQ
jgi:DNA-binding transcriptional regulator WhiA